MSIGRFVSIERVIVRNYRALRNVDVTFGSILLKKSAVAAQIDQ